MLTIAFMYMLPGCVAGLLAGLLGVGGGLVIVPILLYMLPLQGIDTPYINHLALGTSLASIVFTSLSSVRAHHKRGAVLWDSALRFAPGILAGTFLGGCIAARLPSRPLTIIFIIFLCCMALQMFMNMKPKAARGLPGGAGLTGAGAGIGFVSSFVGIGGGSITVPFLLWCNVDMRLAVGTSAGVGLPIALAGALSYIVNGWGLQGLPEYSFGFIYLPALLGLVTASVCTAPLGARLAYKVSVPALKRFFACFLLCMAANLAYKTFA